MKKKLFLLFFLLSLSLSYYYFHFSSSKPSVHEKAYEVTIVTANNERIKEITIPFLKKKFREKYNADLHVEWVKNGGMNTNIKLVRAAYKASNNTTCGYDILWGGGESIFKKMEEDDLLAPLKLPDELMQRLPQNILGIPLFNKPNEPSYCGCFLSTFGILYNKKAFDASGLPRPKNWLSFCEPSYFNKVSCADPSKSSSFWTMYSVFFQSFGWQKGWSILTRLAGNSLFIMSNTSGPINNLTEGQVMFVPSIAFYAQNVIAEIGEDNLGFILPPLQENCLNIDPIAPLKGAPNAEIARFCISCLLGKEFQQSVMLKNGAQGVKRRYSIGRIAVNPEAYQGIPDNKIGCALNPFAVDAQTTPLDMALSKKRYHVVSSLFKACLIKPHRLLKEAWHAIISHGMNPEDLKRLVQPPVDLDELNQIIGSKEWKDPLYRNKKEIEWSEKAIARYKSIIAQHSP